MFFVRHLHCRLDIFSFLQTSLRLSWTLFGGSHRTLSEGRMNTSQEMTLWHKVRLGGAVSPTAMKAHNEFGARGRRHDLCCCRLCGRTRGSVGDILSANWNKQGETRHRHGKALLLCLDIYRLRCSYPKTGGRFLRSKGLNMHLRFMLKIFKVNVHETNIENKNDDTK